MVFKIFVLSFLFVPLCYAKDTASRADLTITQGGSAQKVITKNDFRQLHLDSIEVNDPVYNKQKRFAGYWLLDIFDLAGIHPDPKTIWIFTALDGYKASIDVEDVLQYGVKAFVAVRDLDATDDWQKIKQGKEWISPGPYYLVWQTPLKDVTPDVKLPWPYQLVKISIEDASASSEKLFPDNNEKDGSVRHGYKVFRQNCLSCHSLNLTGGVLGPELNVPKNILEYQDRGYLKTFIKNPSSFRAHDKMPPFDGTLSSQDIDDVLDYLTWMGKHQISSE